jgi:imidazolonepropionase-like amidohydrolase/Tol biopolymer transport system component
MMTVFLLFSVPLSSFASEPASATEVNVEEEVWDVNSPPGPRGEVEIDTKSGTWMSVDIDPKGHYIIFDLLGDIYRLPIEGGEATSLGSGMAWDMQPRYSPDGMSIAFTSDRAGGDNLWLMDADGNNPRALTKESFRLLNSPTWTPDGQYVAGRKHFTAQRSLGAGEIWIYHTAGGAGLQMTEKSSDQKDLGEPAFSPDGRYLYYSRDASSGSNFSYNKDPNTQIYVIERLDRESGEIKYVTGGPGGAIRPTPSPDGRHLAFLRRERSKTLLMLRDLSSGEERRLADDLDHDMQETWAVHGVYPGFDWTPDGKSLIFWAKGGLHRLDVRDGARAEIPFHVKDTREIREALRFPVSAETGQVGESNGATHFPVRMVRGLCVSPDGRRAVFQALGHLWIQDLPSGEAKRLTRDARFEFDPAWSADGKWISYASWDDEDLGGIHMIRPNGRRQIEIDVGKGHYRSPIMTPDGRSLVYRKTGGGWLRSPLWSQDQGLYIVDISSEEPELLYGGGNTLHFSSDPNQLYFTNRNEEGLRLQSIHLKTREVQTRATSQMGQAIRISPDGRWFAFVDNQRVHLMARPSTGGPLSLSPSVDGAPLRQLSTVGGRDLNFSGDSSGLYWRHGSQLFYAPTEGSEDTHEDIDPLAELGFEQSLDHPKGVSAIVGAKLLTMDSERSLDGVIEDGTILWDGNRIVQVGQRSEVEIPQGANVIDGKGLTVMPGLVDVHFHGGQASDGILPQQNWINLSALSFGVTTVHDPSNNTEMVFSASELQRSGDILGPRIFSTGTIIYGAKGRGYFAEVNSLDDALEHIAQRKGAGAFTVKSYNQPRRDQRQQLLEASRQLEMMVVPEGGSLMMHNLSQIVDGHTGIEHAIPVAPLYEDVLQLWSGTSVGYTPTLGVSYGGLMGENYWYRHTDVWNNERLLAFVPQTIIDQAARRAEHVPDDEYHHISISRSVAALQERGVNIQLGAHGQREGLAAHWELWMFEQGGMTPLQALKAGSLGGAKYIGLDGDIGSIEAGKLADFAVLSADPLLDLSHSTSVQWTVLNGRIYDSKTMEQLWPQQKQVAPLWFQNDGGTQPTISQQTHCGCQQH